MKYAMIPTPLCRNKNKLDAKCRSLPRCKACNRVLAFRWGKLCPECAADMKGGGQCK